MTRYPCLFHSFCVLCVCVCQQLGPFFLSSLDCLLCERLDMFCASMCGLNLFPDFPTLLLHCTHTHAGEHIVYEWTAAQPFALLAFIESPELFKLLTYGHVKYIITPDCFRTATTTRTPSVSAAAATAATPCQSLKSKYRRIITALLCPASVWQRSV